MKKTIWSKVVSLIIAMALVLTPQIPSLSLVAIAASTGGYGASGKFLAPISNPDHNAIKIYSAQDLNNIRNNASGFYVLMNDIDLSGFNGGEWIPIEQQNKRISVVLDGQGHVIKNLNITSNAYEDVGLFGFVEGTIKNVGIENININIKKNDDSQEICVGGLAGKFWGDSIVNCYCTGYIKAVTSSDRDLRIGVLLPA